MLLTYINDNAEFGDNSLSVSGYNGEVQASESFHLSFPLLVLSRRLSRLLRKAILRLNESSASAATQVGTRDRVTD